MSSEKKKTARSAPKSNQRSKKRQRIESAESNVSRRGTKRPRTLDELPWNEAKVPEMFEDAEGFLCLEEVDGVEVVRQGDTIQFSSNQCGRMYDDVFEGFSDDETVRTRTERIRAKVPEEGHDRKRKSNQALVEPTVSEVDLVPQLEENIFVKLNSYVAPTEVDVSCWKGLNLSSATLSALSRLGFASPTQIQVTAIPEILSGHDVIGKAPTGSGKTLAFGIPILEKWMEMNQGKPSPRVGKPTALILSPTRELAHQLNDHIVALCASIHDSPYVAVVTGGMSLQKQQRQLQKADIVIGTPGRLWEVISSSTELSNSFRMIDFLVVDEADRLLAHGHFQEIEEIISSLDRMPDIDEDQASVVTPRQTLVFSATFHQNLQQKLAGKGRQFGTIADDPMQYLLRSLNFREKNLKYIDVNPTSHMAEGLREGIVECGGLEKDLYLYALLLFHPNQRILIFTNSIHSVRRLTPFLQHLNLPASALHSQMAQKARLRAIERFTSTSCILVATDVAARGLDINGVELVIHYHLPRTAEMYVHRSGRTARASASGSSILLCAPEEVVGTRRLVAKVHAQKALAAGGNETKHYIRSLDLDRKVITRLTPRVRLAKRIADSLLAKEKKGHDDNWIRNAAEELGVEYDSDEFETASNGRKGRGAGRNLKEKEARELTRGELNTLKGELKALLSQRLNVGVSERYLTAGTVDIGELLRGAKGNFLGRVGDLEFSD